MEIKNFEDLKTLYLQKNAELEAFLEKASGELAETNKVSGETKAAVEAATAAVNDITSRLDTVEASMKRAREGAEKPKTVGQMFVKGDQYKAMQTGERYKASFDTKAIVNEYPAGTDQPLVDGMRVAGIFAEPNRVLTIRDLLPTNTTDSNLIEFAREDVFTNSAAPQFDASPGAIENVLKAESDITFTHSTTPVITLAHFILVSRQVLDDAGMLQGYIDGRLRYGLKFREEQEILNGDGTTGSLNGLINQATAYNRGSSNDTKVDTIRKVKTQLQLSEYPAEVVVVNPVDWEELETAKDTNGMYLFANPQGVAQPRMWGLPLVVTNAITAGTFLVANMSMAAALFDRQQARVELSREDSDNFRRNMVTLLAEERLALAVYRPAALITGAF